MNEAAAPVTRVVTLWVAAMVLLSSPAAAQKTVFVKGLTELTRAMMALPEDTTRVNAAIDMMTTGLAGWEAGSTPSVGSALLDDQASSTPVLPLAAYAEGFTLILRGEYHEAVVSLRRAAAGGADERSELVAAGALAQQGQSAEAERALRSIVAAFPESGVAHWWLGRVYENLNRVSDARGEYEVVVRAALSGRAQLYAAIGRLSRVAGDFVRATDALERRVQISPNDPAAHKDLAWIYLDQDRTDEALAELSAAISIDPRDAEAHAAIGRIRLDAGLHAEAIPALRRALDLMPTLYGARYALALALKQTGRADEAARELELFERARREATEDRRRTMAADVRKEEGARQDRAR